MHKRSTLVFAIAAAMSLSPMAHAATNPGQSARALEHALGSSDPIHCLPGWELFLPGDYYACRALYHLQREHPAQAVEMLKEAAYWANKGAQHALGLVYLNGDIAGVEADRPLGIAWLALAAERKDADYARDYSRTVKASSPAEVAQAQQIYQRLRREYGDRTAGTRALHRFNRRIRSLDESAAMGRNYAQVPGLSRFPQHALDLARKIHAQADEDFAGLRGTVTVGALENVGDSSPAVRDTYKQPPSAQGTADQPG